MKTGQKWPDRKDRDDCNDRVSLKSPQNANNTSFPNNQTLEHLLTKTWQSLLQVGGWLQIGCEGRMDGFRWTDLEAWYQSAGWENRWQGRKLSKRT